MQARKRLKIATGTHAVPKVNIESDKLQKQIKGEVVNKLDVKELRTLLSDAQLNLFLETYLTKLRSQVLDLTSGQQLQDGFPRLWACARSRMEFLEKDRLTRISQLYQLATKHMEYHLPLKIQRCEKSRPSLLVINPNPMRASDHTINLKVTQVSKSKKVECKGLLKLDNVKLTVNSLACNQVQLAPTTCGRYLMTKCVQTTHKNIKISYSASLEGLKVNIDKFELISRYTAPALALIIMTFME